MQLIYSFTVSLFITIAFIPVLIKHSSKLKLLDDPCSERKVHTTAIPRSGGIAMALGIFSPLFFLLDLNGVYKGIYFGAFVIVFFGVLDDIFELSYQWKFGGQIIAVAILILNGVILHDLPFFHLDSTPIILSYFITFMFVLGVTNAINLTDGLDGLAGGTTLISLSLIAIFAIKIENEQIALFAITTIGGIMGFLRYNTYPAKIFMGDAGSQLLGFIAAALSIMVTQDSSSAISPAIPLLIVGLPILDTFTVMFIRLKEGRSPFSPDKNHLHHQIMKFSFYHNEAVAIIYLLQILLAIFAYFMSYKDSGSIILFYIVFSSIILTTLYRLHISGYKFRCINELNPKERRNKLLRNMEWMYERSGKIIEVCFVILVIAGSMAASSVSYDIAVVSIIILIFGLFSEIFHLNMRLSLIRIIAYTCSVFVVFLLSRSNGAFVDFIDIYLVILAVLLMLSIRITRKTDFSLDNQDLLILVMIVIVPQLPFVFMEKFAVSQIVLRLAVLMYACELIIAKAKNKDLKMFKYGLLTSLLILSIKGFI